jgi:hypothetical protein
MTTDGRNCIPGFVRIHEAILALNGAAERTGVQTLPEECSCRMHQHLHLSELVAVPFSMLDRS